MLKMVIGWVILAGIGLAAFRLTGRCRGNRCGRCCSGIRDCGSCHIPKSVKRGKK